MLINHTPMKVLYSSLKQYVPDLAASAREVADILTLIGYMADRFEEVTYQGKADVLISLEVRQNRADCFSVIGIAREVAAYYGLSLQVSSAQEPQWGTSPLSIRINATDPIRRVLAVQLDSITVGPSPEWLKEFLLLHGMNSINILVDLSNYVMLLTGYPSHLIDTASLKGELVWSMNSIFETIETLDGTTYPLTLDERYLLIHDASSPVALAGVVGSRYGAIAETTTSLIVEMAVYDPAVIRDNMRSLHIYTEAGNRLGKELDPRAAYDAFCLLVSLLQEHARGAVSAALFEYFSKPASTPAIIFDPRLPSSIAGIEIPNDQVRTILSRLSFDIEEIDTGWSVSVPPYRTDVSCAEDLAEEVVRMVGYDRINSATVPALLPTRDITPLHVRWADVIQDILVYRGYDEVRSLPLVSSELNASVRYRDQEVVVTQNAVNEEYPELRQSVLTGMLLQNDQYQKRNVDPVQIFEYGKAFGIKGDEHIEHDMIALAYGSQTHSQSIARLHEDISVLIARMGLRARFKKAAMVPTAANPYSCWDIVVSEVPVGIIFALSNSTFIDSAVAEIDMTLAVQLIQKSVQSSVAELTTKLVDLDTNVVLSGDQALDSYIDTLYSKLSASVWSIVVVDRYPLEHDIRYTLRVTYRELSDTQAKQLHLETFELNT